MTHTQTGTWDPLQLYPSPTRHHLPTAITPLGPSSDPYPHPPATLHRDPRLNRWHIYPCHLISEFFLTFQNCIPFIHSMRFTPTQIENFKHNLLISRNPPPPGMKTPCHVWFGSTTRFGYGYFRIGEKMMYVTHIGFMIAGNEVHKGRKLRHHCSDALCCNPEHLYLATQRPPPKSKRELTNEEKTAVRVELAMGSTPSKIAKELGLPVRGVRLVLLRKIHSIPDTALQLVE